ncbi:large subunit ribosomal protein L9 [Metamycoplasma subdolum]|uniref:Large ribosomal subunit protein bL9 n=2 Tax=Metamycoplasma subdolum TaxID=92407 RepID=A0A3L9ZX36_9BACT|nr:50S ribosomal protein L9 [Metamycoplasma subdolum]RMA77431.1 large subunit ribosomal protein L9 [Metamycoplasma subdolum]WPB50393.1 50S ribosomal protein L9 [Metamycoplasma subdolum]
MKVILIKPYQKYKVNEIIEVTDGFAKNFLIKNGYAQPVNKQTLANLDRIKTNIKTNLAQEIEDAHKIKEELEKITITFELKTHNNVVHGSITHKAIHKEVEKFGIKLPKNSITGDSLNTIGMHKVLIELHPQVKAFLNVLINEAK